MPANSKWPDFQLASKLRHFMGTQSSVPEGVPTDKASSSSTSLFGGGPNQQQRDQEYIDDSQDPTFNAPSAAMSATDHQQIDVEDDLDALSHDEGGVDLDATDYGDLEMFDSNASQVFYPEPLDMNKPEPQPTHDNPGPSSSKREKRKKKDKSKAKPALTAAPAAVDEVEDAGVETAAAELLEPVSPGKKRKRSKKKSLKDSEMIDSQLNEVDEGAAGDAATASGAMQDSHEPLLAASSQLTRKRGPADSAEGKQRKKRKSKALAGEEVIPGTQGDDFSVKPEPAQAHAHASFLRSHRGNGADAHFSSIEEGADREPESQLSPSAARARRRSQSIGLPHSREASVPFRAAVAPMAPMAVDGASRARDAESMDLESANEHAQGDKADADVESLAREAWREHVSTQQDDEDNNNSAPENEDGTNPGTSKRRSARGKKQKAAASDEAAQAESSSAAAAVAADSVIDPNLSAKAPPQKKTRGKIAVKSSKGKPPVQDKKSSGAPPKLKKDGDEAEKEDADGEEEEEAGGRKAGDTSQYKANGFLQGRFSDDELAKITRAVEAFRVESGLTQFEMNEMIHAPGGTAAGSSHAELWLRLTAQCPDRKRQKVINVTRKKFHNFVARGTWTAEQDTELSELIKINGTAWSKIAAIINRHPEDVRDRYRNYIVCGAAQRKDVWDEDEETRLRFHVQHAMDTIDELRKSSSSDKSLLNNTYEELIDWQGISEKMDRTRSRLQCITKWKLMTRRDKEAQAAGKTSAREAQAKKRTAKLDAAREQLAAMEEPEQYRLVLAIHKAGPESDTKIPWDKLVDRPFRNKWSRGCQLLLWDRLKRSVPEWDKKTMREITQYIINLYNHTGRMPESDQAPDDERELEVVKQTRAREVPATQPKSAEVVEDSGAEDEAARKVTEAPQTQPQIEPQPQPQAETQVQAPAQVQVGTDDLDMNIDPALSSQVPQSAQGPVLAPKPALKTNKEKQTDAEKGGAGKRKSRKAAGAEAASSSKDAEGVPADDTMEVDAGANEVEAVAAAAAAAASAKDTSKAGKRGGGKNKSPAKAKTTRARKETKSAVVAQEDVSDSDMDDMEDLPARTPSSATRARK